MKATIRTLAVLFAAFSLPAAAFDLQSQHIHVTAHGNNPDWTLEIPARGDRLDFTLEGSAGQYRYARGGPSLYLGDKATVYNVMDDAHTMRVYVVGKACRDSLTGKSFETTVTVYLDGKGYAGCGDVLNR